jgi:hypothetical protein
MLPTDQYKSLPTPNPTAPVPSSPTPSFPTAFPNASPTATPVSTLASPTPTATATPRRRDMQPDGDYVDRGAALSRLPKLPFEAFLVVLMGAILLLVVFLNGRSSLSDARQDRDAAIADVDALTERATSAEQRLDELAADNVTLADQVTALKEAARTTAEASNADDDSTLQDQLTERDDTITELESTNADLIEANESLTARVDEIESSDVEAAGPTSGPAFELFLGELLASENGVRIEPLQSVCLSRFVIDDIGLDAIGAGLSTEKSTVTNDLLIQSMVRGAESCAIDPALIF